MLVGCYIQEDNIDELSISLTLSLSNSLKRSQCHFPFTKFGSTRVDISGSRILVDLNLYTGFFLKFLFDFEGNGKNRKTDVIREVKDRWLVQ